MAGEPQLPATTSKESRIMASLLVAAAQVA